MSTCSYDVTCDKAFWLQMIQHHHVGIQLLKKLQNKQDDPSLLLFTRTVSWALEQNAHRMLLFLKGKTDLMKTYANEPFQPSCQSTVFDYYTQPVCGPVKPCPISCREDLRDPEKANNITWSCVQDFFAILIEHHLQGIQMCETKSKSSPNPLVQSEIHQIIPFLKKNILDMTAFMKQHCAYTFTSPLLRGS